MTVKDNGYLLGHYRTAVRVSSTAAQAANSRIFEVRNPHASNIIVPTRLRLRALQTVIGTAQENSLDVYKCTGFTTLDTTNVATPSIDSMKTNMPAPTAQVRNLAANVAGMTGGTLVKPANFLSTLPYNVLTTAVGQMIGVHDAIEESNPNMSPYMLATNEGLIVESSVLNVISFGIVWYIDFAWAEFSAYA